MTVVLPILWFGLTLVCFRHRSIAGSLGWRGAFLSAAVLWGLAVALGTELLSAFGAVTLSGISGFWMTGLFIGLAVFLKIRRHVDFSSPVLRNLSAVDGWLLGGIGIVLAVVGVVGVVAPPNNWDSMAYHMSRVVHWIQNHTLAHYPTYCPNQLWKGTWAETAILHLQVLSGSDRFAASVQWFSMLGSAIGVSLIARQMGVAVRGQILAAVWAVTFPMGILQGSSTQNDFVLAFWIVCLAFFLMRAMAAFNLRDAAMAATACALALLTKEIGYFYIVPFGVWAAVWLGVQMTRRYDHRFVWAAVIFVLIIGLVVGPHWLRNFRHYGNVIAPAELQTTVKADIYSPDVIFLQIVRNAALHLTFPWAGARQFSERMVTALHHWLGRSMNDPALSMGSVFGIPHDILHEDNAGNVLHFFLGLVLIMFFVFLRQYRQVPLGAVYLAAVLGMFVTFCVMVRWEPYHSRLHVACFVLFAPFAGMVLAGLRQRWPAVLVGGLLLLGATPWVFANTSRPIVGENSIFLVPRTEQYFANQKGMIYSYRAMVRELKSSHCNQVGIVGNENSWEYPLWALLSQDRAGLSRIEHVFTTPPEVSYPRGTFDPCGVIYLETSGPVAVSYQGTKFVKVRQMAFASAYLRDTDGTLTTKALAGYFLGLWELYGATEHLIAQSQTFHKLPENLPVIVQFHRKMLSQALDMDQEELNGLYPGLKDSVHILLIPGLQNFIAGIERRDQNQLTDSQQLLGRWRLWLATNGVPLAQALKKVYEQ